MLCLHDLLLVALGDLRREDDRLPRRRGCRLTFQTIRLKGVYFQGVETERFQLGVELMCSTCTEHLVPYHARSVNSVWEIFFWPPGAASADIRVCTTRRSGRRELS